MDLEHLIESFLALLSNHDPSFWLPDDRDEKVLDFCITLMSIFSLTSISPMAKWFFSSLAVAGQAWYPRRRGEKNVNKQVTARRERLTFEMSNLEILLFNRQLKILFEFGVFFFSCQFFVTQACQRDGCLRQLIFTLQLLLWPKSALSRPIADSSAKWGLLCARVESARRTTELGMSHTSITLWIILKKSKHLIRMKKLLFLFHFMIVCKVSLLSNIGITHLNAKKKIFQLYSSYFHAKKDFFLLIWYGKIARNLLKFYL